MSTQEYNMLLPYIKIGNGEIAIDSISTIDIENGYSVGHNALWNKLSNEEIVPFFKGLVICEKVVHEGMGYGSATPTKVVYSAILERGLDQDYKIGDWAFRYSSNPYIPVDSGNRHGASTIYEFFEWQKNNADQMSSEAKHPKDFETKPFAEMVAFNLEQLHYRFDRLQNIDTTRQENNHEYLMCFDSFLVLFRAMFLDASPKQFSVQNYYKQIGKPEKAQAIDDFLNTPVLEWANLTIRKMLKTIADNYVCHIDNCTPEELAQSNYYMSHLSNPYSTNNLRSIWAELNKIMSE